MKTGVIVINFGEPSEPTLERVTPFLERIFFKNAPLERGDEESRLKRSRELAQERAPGLVEEYSAIGGSPLNAQADAQAAAVEEALGERGHDVQVYSAYQYTPPSIAEQLEEARTGGCERIVALPVYPLCGHSTTVLALEDVETSIEALDWDVEAMEIGGWHRHPDFGPMWADHVRRYVRDRGADLSDPETALLFSIHGTPIRYLESGSRYDRYVDEACADIARGLSVARYHMGYQNHTNRPIAWTQPDVDAVVRTIADAARRVVVVPVAFMHEQSETLAELDLELWGVAEEAGLDFHRVPVPHDDPRFAALLADLVESRIAHEASSGVTIDWRRCVCRGAGGRARCTNGLRLTGTVELGSTAG